MGVKNIVIIPAYNEEENIAGVVLGIKKVVPDADIVVVNDGGQDRTGEIARKSGGQVISLPFNMGYGVALQTGFKYALRRGYEYAVQMDADGQHDPRDILSLLQAVKSGEADVAIGSRFLEGNSYRIPALRRLGMFIFSFLASVFTGQRITDPTSGYQALNRRGLMFYASDYYPVDFPDADVIIMLHRAGLKVKEVPVTMHSSTTGRSMHSGLKPLYYIFKMFLSIFVTLLRKNTVKADMF